MFRLERRPTTLVDVAFLAAVVLSVGLPLMIFASQLIVVADGRSLDEGETVMYLQPASSGIRVWQGPYTIEGRTRDGRLILAADEQTVHASLDEVEPLNRW